MRILVTGAGGMLGLDVCAAALAAGHEVTARPRSELDIGDPKAVEGAISAARPDVVINCAAYTNVDGAESDPQAAHAVNEAGAGHVAAAAAAHAAWVIHISSDYVFDGTKTSPYVESDRTGPISTYGASKLAGEQAVSAAAPGGHTVVRSSWLFGTGGPCFPATMLRLASEQEELAVVEDQIGCPTFTGHLATGLIELAERPTRPVGILHAAAEGHCCWHEFATEILRRANASVAVRPISTAEFPRPARRPAYSVLGTERGPEALQLPSWQEGLAEYLSGRLAVR